MADDFTYDVFLSHSSKDKAVVRAVAERLRKDGLKVWFDEWVLKPGDSIPAKIEEGLEHSRVLVLCMSANAFGSDWAQLEAGTFRFRDPLNQERRFIPLRLDDAPIKGSLAQFLYINWLPADREQEYAKLLEACRPPATADGRGSRGRSQSSLQKRPSNSTTATLISCLRLQSRWQACPHRRPMARPCSCGTWRRGHCLRVFEGHSGGVSSVAWSPDQCRALSSSHDKTLRLWDVMTGRCLRLLEGHTGTVGSCSVEHR